jgi:hypothetical protein
VTWKFGVGQTARQEAREIKAATRSGRVEEYLRCQARARALARMAEVGPRMIEAETARRRARHHQGRTPLTSVAAPSGDPAPRRGSRADPGRQRGA